MVAAEYPLFLQNAKNLLSDWRNAEIEIARTVNAVPGRRLLWLRLEKEKDWGWV